MRKLVLMLTACALALALAGCTRAVISTYDLARLQKGMSQARVEARLDARPDEQFVVHLVDESYIVQVFRMSSGGYLSDYLLAYQDDELMFWGYPHEFARAHDPKVNRIGALARTELQRRGK